MLPNPLDVAFAGLGNNARRSVAGIRSGHLPELRRRRCMTRAGWSTCTATISGAEACTGPGWARCAGCPFAGGDPTAAAGLPAVMQTEAWARRVLNTQLASWAELRHDTLLYAKQSYTGFRPATIQTPTSILIPRRGPASCGWRSWGSGSLADCRRSPRRWGSVGAYFARVESVATTLGAHGAGRTRRPAADGRSAGVHQSGGRRSSSSGGCVATVIPTGWYAAAVLQPDGRAKDRSDDRRRPHGSRRGEGAARRDRAAAPHVRDRRRVQRTARLCGRRVVVLRADDGRICSG